ncbi:hypothetical protein A678_03880 [Salmonella enterica subsp. enterica serovar Enteritidis str. 2010K-0271]|uniref:Uncharacterized protein n=2 Tax=Salmonella enterica I TaxID=59201 RepID=M7RH35_SALDU|nr:hypothetical protein A670_01859 [Salmonella enterica subsp. enterica serovar Dublin str. UC16]EPI68194.1 hypothetical protein A673_02948 [Salmonella enterica subsp. enterica serovar Enteritidis str. 2009K0958]EPI73203.1 hypothetical protein A672_01985 [Salmonella enterica subsp. enterica serovar Enteritidis str. 08-1080]EPI94420.1 hypothetical protein A678_03880 [Salmonella enterica subsp. enterica serovar Enteritidis str. 2010K-0271]
MHHIFSWWYFFMLTGDICQQHNFYGQIINKRVPKCRILTCLRREYRSLLFLFPGYSLNNAVTAR